MGQVTPRRMPPRSFVLRLPLVSFISAGLILLQNKHFITLENEELQPTKDSVSSAGPVRWIHDTEWFQEKAKKGCCPYAKVLYKKRYANIEYRCCTSRLQELEPLKAVGGRADFPVNVTLLIQGDSLAEQHFLGILCFAWSQDLTVKMIKNVGGLGAKDGTMWEFLVNDTFYLTFARKNRLGILPTVNYVDYDFWLFGGWHHEELTRSRLESFVKNMTDMATTSYQLVFLEALPDHFPGGSYRGNGVYPPISNTTLHNHSSSAVCETSSFQGSPPLVNTYLSDLVSNYSHAMDIIYLEELYYHMGQAHIGTIPKGSIGHQHRDCLHFCIAPGVWDAATRQTLATLARLLLVAVVPL